MEPEIRQRISEAVLEILKSSNMDETTEYKVRKMASEKLGLDLSSPDYKRFVRQVVESYLSEQQSKADEEEQAKQAVDEEEGEEEDDDRKRKRTGAKEFDDDGDLIICKLSEKRRVTIQDFRGKTLVSMREYYRRDGKDLLLQKDFASEQDNITPVNGWKAYYAATRAIVNANSKIFNIIREMSLPTMSRLWLNADYVKCFHASGEYFTGYNAVMESWHMAFSWEQGIDFQVRDLRAQVLSTDRHGLGYHENLCC